MKLAEALILRADLNRRFEQVKARAVRNVKVQEGDTSAEDAVRLIGELNGIADQLARVIRQINRTNATAAFDQTMTITDALAERDRLAMLARSYRELSAAASVDQQRYMRTELRFVATVDIPGLERQADDLSRQFRMIDTRIQELNWQTELRED